MELTGTNRSRALLNTISRKCATNIYNLLCGFQSTNSDRFSGDSYEGPPVPISNTVVKLVNAESTWLETAWEDRKSLIKLKRGCNRMRFYRILVAVPLKYKKYQEN